MAVSNNQIVSKGNHSVGFEIYDWGAIESNISVWKFKFAINPIFQNFHQAFNEPYNRMVFGRKLDQYYDDFIETEEDRERHL